MRLSLLLIFALLNTNLWAQSNSKGPDSPVVVGHIVSADGNRIDIQHSEFLRKMTINKKTKIVFVSFLGVKEELKEGYPIKGRANKQTLTQLYVTLPVTNFIKRTPDMPSMSAKELYQKTDLDKNGSISYVELSRVIYNSPKHGPDNFDKQDKNKSGSLELDEFTTFIKKVDWWRISQKTPEEWISFSDKNGDGELSVKEFSPVNGGDGHIESRFKRVDKDKSGTVNLKEVSAYITGVVGK